MVADNVYNRWRKTPSHRDLIPKYVPVYRDIRLSRCESCQRVFTNKNDLKHHISLTHSGSKPYACVLCGKRYSQVHHLNSHFNLHREPRLQEFAILKHRHKAVSEPASGLNTTVGSFKVSRALKHFIPEPTFKSFGTLQSFTVTQLNTPEIYHQSRRNDKKSRAIHLTTSGIHDPIIYGRNSFQTDRGQASMRVARINIAQPATKETLPSIKTKHKVLMKDVEAQTAKTSSTKRKPAEKDYWVVSDADWHTHKSLKDSDGHGSLTSFSDRTRSLFSEPMAFKASTPIESKVLDDPIYLSGGKPGVRKSSGFDPTCSHHENRRKSNRHTENAKMNESGASSLTAISK